VGVGGKERKKEKEYKLTNILEDCTASHFLLNPEYGSGMFLLNIGNFYQTI
jgi:hypothetical protein